MHMQSNKRFMALFSSTVGAVYDRPPYTICQIVCGHRPPLQYDLWQSECDDAVAGCPVVVTSAASDDRNILSAVLALIRDRRSIPSSFQFHVPENFPGF